MNDIRITGIKKTVSDVKKCINTGLYSQIFLNAETGKVWNTTHADPNGYVVYDDPAIIPLYFFSPFETAPTMRGLKNYATEIMKTWEAEK